MTTDPHAAEAGEALSEAELRNVDAICGQSQFGMTRWNIGDERLTNVDIIVRLLADNRRLRRALQGGGGSDGS